MALAAANAVKVKTVATRVSIIFDKRERVRD
jgi:hypothetical protein